MQNKILIGLEGVSCSGKSSLIERYDGEFYHLSELQVAPADIEDIQKWFLQTTLGRAEIARKLSQETQRSIILDRTHVSSLAYNLTLDALYKSTTARRLIDEFSRDLANPRNYPDIHIYFEISHDIAMERIKARFSLPHPEWSNKNFVRIFDYFSRAILFKALSVPCFLIDGAREKAVVDAQFRAIVEAFEPRKIYHPCNLEKLLSITEAKVE